jgi:S-adenosylmethionine:tRNA ribosyltransferase-isomerase
MTCAPEIPNAPSHRSPHRGRRPQQAARGPRPDQAGERLLVIDPASEGHRHARVDELGRFLRPGDLLVLNDAATLPASLWATTADGEDVEVRLAGERGDGTWSAVLFGEGDWRLRTEDRPPPPRLEVGETLRFAADLHASIDEVSAISPRLVTLRFDRQGPAFWRALYRLGRPVQYSYVAEPYALWDVQTAYATRPWAVEMPSAGRPLTWALLDELRRGGVAIATLTHAAGLSSTGDPALDAALPLAERYEIPASTALAVGRARAQGGRVIAVGTTVVRALESAAREAVEPGSPGPVRAGEGRTELKLGPADRLRVVDGLFTGMHEPEASHYALLQTLVARPLLDRAYAEAATAGYLWHEQGDSSLILPGALSGRTFHSTPAWSSPPGSSQPSSSGRTPSPSGPPPGSWPTWPPPSR